MYAYAAFNDGKMTDYIPSDEELEASFAKLPKIGE
jgi:tryptophan synthase beta chain